METNKKNESLYIGTLILLCLLLLAAGYRSVVKDYEAKLSAKDKLYKGLSAKMVTTVDELGRERNEKLSLQAKLIVIEDHAQQLTENQKDLIKYVKSVEKNHTVIAAGIIDMKVRLSKLSVEKPVEETDTTITFAVETDSIKLVTKIHGATALAGKTPSMDLIDLEIPNKILLDFNWGERKEGYPVSFRVTNTNPMFQVNNIDSYVIPELVKEKVKPNFWQKTKMFVNGKLVPVLIGVGIGAGAVLILL